MKKNPLNNRFLRDLRDDLGKYVVIALLMIFTIGFVSGFLVADGSMVKAYNESFTKYNVEDGNFRLQKKMNKAQWKSVEGLGLYLYELFYREFALDNGSTLRVFQNRDQVDLVCLMEGEFPQKPGEIAIDRMYADNNGLKVGDTIRVADGSTEVPAAGSAGDPASGQAAVFSTANIIIQAAINSLGTSVAAASSAAFNIEIFSYYVLNSFGQACTTITGQNYGAKKIDRCKKTLKLCMLEGIVIEGLMVFTLILFGKQLIAIFNPDPELVEIGYIRIVLITTAHLFSLFYDVMSGYMRGYGISLTPAIITMISVCGIRIFWIYTIFQQYHTFESIMTVYPISLGTTSVLMFILLLIWHPAKRFGKIDKA